MLSATLDTIVLPQRRFVPRFTFPIRIRLKFLIQHSGIVFILLGGILLSAPRVSSFVMTRLTPPITEDQSVIRPDDSFKNSTANKQIPIRIVIPSIQIDIPIVEAKLSRGVWETSETNASFGTGSATPDEKGNTVIFAHAREKLFLPLKDIKTNDHIYVFTQNMWHQYTVEEIKEVKPKDTYVIKQTPDKRLTLFTCSGFLDSRRLVVVAKPMN